MNWEQCISEFENDGFTILPTRIDTDLVEKSKDLVTEALADAHQRVKTIKGHDLKVTYDPKHNLFLNLYSFLQSCS